MHSIKAICTLALSTLIVIGYASNTMSSEFARVTGMLSYQGATMLPPDAVIYITLVDVSPRQDTSAEIIARQIIRNLDRVPIPFELKYDLARVTFNNTYAIQVHITAKGKLLFTNTSPYPVIMQGNSNTVDVVVNPVD